MIYLRYHCKDKEPLANLSLCEGGHKKTNENLNGKKMGAGRKG
jgi:hypothetical protein